MTREKFVNWITSRAFCYLMIVLLWIELAIPFIIYNVYSRQVTSNSSSCSVLNESIDNICSDSFTEISLHELCICSNEQNIEILMAVYDELQKINLTNLCINCEDEVMKLICLHSGIYCSSKLQNLPSNLSNQDQQKHEACQNICNELKTSGCNEVTSLIYTYAESSRNTTSLHLNCSEFFYYDNTLDKCLPDCYLWRNLELSTTSKIQNRLAISALFIGWIGLIIFLLIAVVRYKSMLIFPSIIVVCFVFNYFLVDIFILANLLGQESLSCLSQNLQEHPPKVHPFCAFTALVSAYLFMQAIHWIFTFAYNIFWAMHYPFHYRKFKDTIKYRYINVANALCAFIVPLIPIVTSTVVFREKTLSEKLYENISVFSGGLGYSNYIYTKFGCHYDNPMVFIYSELLIRQIYIALCIPLLLLSLQKMMKRSSDRTFTLKTAEKKMLIGAIVIIVFNAVTTLNEALVVGKASESRRIINNYFVCEQEGYYSDNVCPGSDIIRNDSIDVTSISAILFGIFQPVVIVYAVDVQLLQKKIRKTYSQLRIRMQSIMN